MVYPKPSPQFAVVRPAENAGEWAILDRNGVIMEVSSAWLRAVHKGIPPCAGALPGKNYYILCKLEERRRPDLAGLRMALRAVIQGVQVAMTLRYPADARDGRESWKEMTMRQISAADDGCVVVSLDVVGSSREPVEPYQDLFARLPVGVLSTDMDGVVRFGNPSAHRLLDAEQGELLGKDLPTLCKSPVERAQLARLLRLAGCAGLQDTAVSLRRGARLVRLRLFEQQPEAGASRLRHWLVEEVEWSPMPKPPYPTDAVAQVTNGLAHDLNNVLNSVAGIADIALQHLRSGAPHRIDSQLEMLRSTGRRGQELVREFLDVGHRRADGEARFDLAAMLSEPDRWIGNEVPSGVAVSVIVEDGLPPVGLSAMAAYRLLMNLILNARDAVGGSGRIDLNLRRATVAEGRCLATGRSLSGDWLELRVEDDGPGISESLLPYLFDPYVTDKPEGAGTGLGLAVVRQIVQRFGAGVQVRRSPMGGASFRVLLPIHGEGAAPRSAD